MLRRRVVVGPGPDGRSAVLDAGAPPRVYRFGGAEGRRDAHELAGMVASADASPAGPGEVVVRELWSTVGGVAPDGRDPVTSAPGFDLEVPLAGTKWRVVQMGPSVERPLHRTVTVDYDLVLEGEIELLLESGPVTLRVGDAVVLPGVVHGWRTGERACVMAVAMVALPDV